MNLLAWAVLGFGQIERYRDLIAALAGAQQDRGYSLMALLSKGGVTPSLATLLTAGLTLACAATCLVAGRAPRGPPGARGLFATCLVATPISWLHYFALLVVPVALARPRLSLLWLAPIALDAPAVGPDATQIRSCSPAPRPSAWSPHGRVASRRGRRCDGGPQPSPPRGEAVRRSG